MEQLTKEEWEIGLRAEIDNAIEVFRKINNISENKILVPDWVASNGLRPCVYDPVYASAIVFGIKIKYRKLPTNFRLTPKSNADIIHINENGCPKLTLQSVVICYAKHNNKYYRCEHKVGKCPFKERRFNNE